MRAGFPFPFALAVRFPSPPLPQSSLIANMLLGMLFLAHRYSVWKYLSVFLITVGLVLCTLEDYRVKHSLEFDALFSAANLTTSPPRSTPEGGLPLWQTTIGVLLLTVSLILSAGTGIYQEFLFTNFGKHAQEALFYVVSGVRAWDFNPN